MRRTFKSFTEVMVEKEASAWNNVKYCEKAYGNKDERYKMARSEWLAISNVVLMLNNQEIFDTAYDVWVKSK